MPVPKLPKKTRQLPKIEAKAGTRVEPVPAMALKVLNERHHDPAKQLNLDELILRIISMAQLLMEKRFYPYQVLLARRIIESLLLHDGEVITSLMARQAGKCLAKGTEILMFDGTRKKVEDVVVGDRLMGDDSTPRRVLSLARGNETLWEVRPRCNYAEPFVVNESHILSLRRRGKRGGVSYVDIPVKEYLALKEWERVDKYSSYKVSVDYRSKSVPIDPYWLGLWLGDGNSRNTSITVGDPEVAGFIDEYAAKRSLRVSTYTEKGACVGVALVNYNPTRSKPNPVQRALEALNLIQNKHIPACYSVNSRAVRLKLLAGLIDSDGCLTKSGYEVTLTNRVLASDIQSLARSLGFRCSMRRCVKSCQTGACSITWRLNLYGELWEVPVKIPRKKFTSKQLREDPRAFGFDLVRKGPGDYFGFVIDGNHRFVLGDYTVTHNTETIGGTSAACAMALPMLAKRHPDDWRLNITDDQGNYRGFAEGLKTGIYAPKLEQSEITFARVKRSVETANGKRLLRELGLSVEENNGNTLAFANGSKVLCQSASKQSEIEGATHNLLIAEEAQDIDDLKMRKSLHPMVASTMGTIVKIGTASTQKCDFYTAIQTNQRHEVITGKRNHFFFPWSVCGKYNSLYHRYIEGEKRKIGEHSDEFRMAYCGEWIFERGMFITQKSLFANGVAVLHGPWSTYTWENFNKIPAIRYHDIVVGIDWGASSDSTVACIMAVDWINPIETGETSDSNGRHRYAFFLKHVIGWWEFQGDNYETQYGELYSRLIAFGPSLRKIIMDSNACGKPLYDRFAANFGPRGVEVSPFNFQAKLKSDGYKALSGDFQARRLTFPAGESVRGSSEYRKFVQQMLDLKKEWKNGIMQVGHPDERNAHDDYADALMLASWGANIPAIGGLVGVSKENPFC